MRRLPPVTTVDQLSNDWLKTVTERLAVYTGVSDPTVSELPNNQWVLFKNTSTNAVNFFYNDNGTLRNVTLTTGSTGDVVGPAGATNNHVVFFDGSTGKLIKDSGLTLSGTNTGDQTSIVGITGTKAQFDTAVTDGNILYVGDVTQYTDEMAQDAVGAMIDTSLTYVDATPLLQRAALTGAVTAAAGSNITALGSFTTAQLNTALSDNDVATGGGTATGTNTGDQYTATTASRLIGRGSAAGAGAAQEITLGDGLSMSGTTVSATGKELLANVTLGSNSTSLASGTISARQFLEIHIWLEGYSGSDTASLQFNGAGGTAYRYRWLTSAAGGTTFAAGLVAASTDRVKIAAVNTTGPRRVVCHINNDSSVTEKLVQFESVFGTGSAATQATIDLGNGAWISGAATQITSVSLVSTSNMLAGTQMVIYGWN